MHTLWRIVLVTLVLSCLTVGCSRSTRNEKGGENAVLSLIDGTPKQNAEAELIALCLSGELVAPDSLYQLVLADLAAIRAEFSDTLDTAGQITFVPPWAPGVLIMGFDVSTVQQIRNGEYHAWDDLNEEYGVVNIDTSLLDFIGGVVLTFHGRLHPYRLAEVYAVLPGAWAASPSGRLCDFPNIYARRTEAGMSYVFRNGWGDCPAGCIYNEHWYFTVSGGQPFFVGYYPEYQGGPAPPWWEEARLNRQHYCNK